jgi:hypothetical protein
VNYASQQPEAPVAPVQSPESHQIDRFLRAEPSPTSVITILDPAVRGVKIPEERQIAGGDK